MQQTAIAEGLTPIALADRNSARFKEMMKALNVSYDDYIRTTEPRHYQGVSGTLDPLENGGVYLGKYAGWYSVRQEAYFDEGETDGRLRRRASRTAGLSGGVDGGGDLLLPAVGLSGQAACALRAHAGLRVASRTLNEVAAS